MADIEYCVSAGLLESELPSFEALTEAILLENGRGFEDLDTYAAYLSRMTLCVTMLAGSGSRWKSSVEAARKAGMAVDFDLEKPRALFPVANAIVGVGTIPVGAYAVNALKGLGDQLVLVRGCESEIRKEILLPLGIDPSKVAFREQAVFNGDPLGHGDAAWQLSALMAGYEYVIVNFGGDLSSPHTALAALCTMDALDAAGADVREVIPAGYVETPDYPIAFDAEGLPVSFGHAKLKGEGSAARPGLTNVGVRVFKSDALIEAAAWFRSRHFDATSGYSVPGNAGNEFALDNVDAWLAEKKTVRILACANRDETLKIKKWDDIAAFERAATNLFGK